MLKALKHCLRASSIRGDSCRMAPRLRHYVIRACNVCEWTDAALEAGVISPSCPWCHAPSRVVREEWLISIGDVRAQAAANGRVGGLKGGRARAERLSPTRRHEIAKQAAAVRGRHCVAG